MCKFLKQSRTMVYGLILFASAHSVIAQSTTSNCCENNGTPGCDDQACQGTVCDIDPICCTMKWDSQCSRIAEAVCPSLCPGGGGDCCEPHNSRGCDDQACTIAVCKARGQGPEDDGLFCCTGGWDSICVGLAESLCSVCGGGGCANDIECDDQNPCTDDTCNTSTGVCSNPAKANGSSCDDSNACTQSDSCQSGVCTGSNPVVCTASDQCHNVGICNTSTGVCSNPAKPNGSSCNDGNACTQSDSCTAGACTGSNPVVCTASDQCHNVGTCNTSTGVCSNPAKPNGSSCDDGNFCNGAETCVDGLCQSGTVPDCNDNNSCTIDSCNTSSDQCVNEDIETLTCADLEQSSEFGVCDSDEDGFPLGAECEAGTDPTDAVSSPFRIKEITREGDDVRIVWWTVGGVTNVVQSSSGDMNGDFNNIFSDLSSEIVIPGSGLVCFDFVDIGGANKGPNHYYKIKLIQ